MLVGRCWGIPLQYALFLRSSKCNALAFSTFAFSFAFQGIYDDFAYFRVGIYSCDAEMSQYVLDVAPSPTHRFLVQVT